MNINLDISSETSEIQTIGIFVKIAVLCRGDSCLSEHIEVIA